MDNLRNVSIRRCDFKVSLSSVERKGKLVGGGDGQLASSTSDSIVVVPTYNERENIEPLIKALRSLAIPLDILVIDDNSPDGTSEVVGRLVKDNEGIYLHRRAGKLGLGSAYKEGFEFALRHSWKYICQMDADFSHDPDDLLRLIQSCRDGADVTLGSRYVKGGKISGWPLSRWLLSRFANLLAQTMLLTRVNDLTGGFKCFRANAIKRIGLDRVRSEGYIFQVEMNHLAAKEKLSIKQIPICFTDRTLGRTKMGKHEAKDGFAQLKRLAVSNMISIIKNRFNNITSLTQFQIMKDKHFP